MTQGKPGTKAPHGTAARYNGHRCRCSRCRKAWTIYFSAKRREWRENGPPRGNVSGTAEPTRALDARWIAAGRRRIVARGLRAEGKTYEQIGAALGVSAEQARRDCQ